MELYFYHRIPVFSPPLPSSPNHVHLQSVMHLNAFKTCLVYIFKGFVNTIGIAMNIHT